MLAKTYSATVIGIDAYVVELEVNVTGKSGGGGAADSVVSIVGLPDAAVKESRDRVRSALTSSGLVHPRGFTVVNLAPADLRKEGAAFDLGIALGMLAAGGALDRARLARTAVLGELSLDGSIRPVRGALPIAARLAAHPEIEEVLLSGGDPMMLADERLIEIIRVFSELEQIKVIRLGTRIPVMFPDRITGQLAEKLG